MTDETPRPTAPAPGPAPLEPSWSREHYGFPPPEDPGVVSPTPGRAPGPDPATGGGPPLDLKPWWNRGRTLAAAGTAAAILAVGAIGFGVGHAAASGPDQDLGVTTFDRQPGDGPGGRGDRDLDR